MHIDKFRWRFVVERVLSLELKGLGIGYKFACIGSTYQEPGRDMIFYIELLFFRWQLSLRFSWKDL